MNSETVVTFTEPAQFKSASTERGKGTDGANPKEESICNWYLSAKKKNLFSLRESPCLSQPHSNADSYSTNSCPLHKKFASIFVDILLHYCTVFYYCSFVCWWWRFYLIICLFVWWLFCRFLFQAYIIMHILFYI